MKKPKNFRKSNVAYFLILMLTYCLHLLKRFVLHGDDDLIKFLILSSPNFDVRLEIEERKN